MARIQGQIQMRSVELAPNFTKIEQHRMCWSHSSKMVELGPHQGKHLVKLGKHWPNLGRILALRITLLSNFETTLNLAKCDGGASEACGGANIKQPWGP